MPDGKELTPAFKRITELMAQYRAKKEKVASNENVPAKASDRTAARVQIHPEVEHPDQGEPAANRSTSRRRGGDSMPDSGSDRG